MNWNAPHFIHAPLYVFTYPFGIIVATALYTACESGVADFESKFFDVLAAGDPNRHSKLLEPFGISVADPPL